MSGSLKTQCGSNRDELLYGQQPGTRHDEIPSGAHLTKLPVGIFGTTAAGWRHLYKGNRV